MAWYAFERDKPFVTEALHRGDFDYVEVVGAVEETKFFEMLLGEGVLDGLAAVYPSPRKKQEVPLWLYLASELTLRLHGANGFGAYPYVLHCGGLVDALGPGQVERRHDNDTGQSCTTMRGFNNKNHYSRVTPCDRDFLRKLAKDTRAEQLESWFGTAVVSQYQALDAFDQEGLFLADGTYLFVPPDNENYEDSSRLLFDDKGHPIGKEDSSRLPKERKRFCQWRRCYRAVTISHTTRQRDYSVRCAVKVLPGKAAEVPELWPMVERFVDAVGTGVMKLLIYDRGLIDGKTVGRLKAIGVDSLFPLKRGMDLWEDAKVLAEHDGEPWQRYELPKPKPAAPPKQRPEAIVRREANRQKTLQKKRKDARSSPPSRKLQSVEYKYIEPSRVWESCPVPVAVLLINNHYANGERLHWALASTRQFVDPLQMWTTYRIRSAVEEDHRQEKCFWDMSYFRSTAFSLVVNQIVFVELAYSLIQIFLRKIGQNQLVGKTRRRLLDCLLPQENKIALYYKQRFGMFRVYEYQEHLLTLKEGARRKVLGKTRRLSRAQLAPLDLPLRPQ